MVSIFKNYPYNGQADYWWLRSPRDAFYADFGAHIVHSDGDVDEYSMEYVSYGRRPAFVLPSSLFVSDGGDVGSDSNGAVNWGTCGLYTISTENSRAN